MRPEIELLKHDADLRAQGVDLPPPLTTYDTAARQFASEWLAGDLDEAVIRLLEPGQAAQQRALAAAARTNQRDDLARVHIEIEIIDGGGAGKALGQGRHAEHGRRGHHALRATSER